MAPPSKLAVATSSVNRLVKEEASYHKEIQQQEARIKKLEDSKNEDENAEYQLKQEKQALEETKKVLPSLRQRLEAAIDKLDEEIESVKDATGADDSEEATRAKEAVGAAKKSIQKSIQGNKPETEGTETT